MKSPHKSVVLTFTDAKSPLGKLQLVLELVLKEAHKQ